MTKLLSQTCAFAAYLVMAMEFKAMLDYE